MVKRSEAGIRARRVETDSTRPFFFLVRSGPLPRSHCRQRSRREQVPRSPSEAGCEHQRLFRYR